MLNSTLLMALGAPEIAIILVIVLLLFGGKKIPELMRGLGKGVKEFKEGKEGTDADAYDRDGNKVNKPL
ncbi:Sec-independent protein translocase subunit TatA/TatB [Pedobacter immunditicola]|uniref:Sec-independent protein translocase subunit TatA/TatB n=1 Tax=Pedobacter immunditicola TaxID=3133440 RepID=UPI0030A50C91